MPRRLVRSAGYGWSYSYGKNQRILSDKFKNNFDQIKWKDEPIDEAHGWEKGPVRPELGRFMRKVYG